MGFFGEKTYIIAEVGSNHKRDFELAKAHIDAAKEAGADAVKFQSLNVMKQYFNPTQKIRDLHEKIDLDESWLVPLKSYADEVEIDFCSSPTYLEAVDLLEDMGVKFHKIASAQVGTFPQLIRKVAKLKKPTLLSTGIVTEEELKSVIEIFKECENDKYTILHCNSIYPTPPKKVNLARMKRLQELFNNLVGFSDHTLGIHIPLSAVALGATVIEKHFVLDRTIETPDSAISITKEEFSLMVSNIRDLEKAKGEFLRERLEEEEEGFKKVIRYKLVLKTDKESGESFSSSDFSYLRGDGGIDVALEEDIIKNYRAKEKIVKNTLLDYENIEKI